LTPARRRLQAWRGSDSDKEGMAERAI
jgi:hypothetical protein